jgi:hypothetical protein
MLDRAQVELQRYVFYNEPVLNQSVRGDPRRSRHSN